MATSLKDIPLYVQEVRKAFNSEKTKTLEWRKTQLRQIMKMMLENQEEWGKALENDLGAKSPFLKYSAQFDPCVEVPRQMLSLLDEQVKPEIKSTPLFLQPGSSEIRREPFGVVLIIAPWNYPITMIIEPLAGAIAAGNAAILKPSEVTPSVSALFGKLVPKYLDIDAIKVVEGGVDETTEVLKQRFDYIFYTGNTSVGKIIMKAASQHLTPVTLELGGKSPCIVDVDSNLDVAAKRILWGKYMNCGQTCISPDYILAVKSIEPQLVEKLLKYLKEFYGDDPQKNTDYSRIVNERHVKRLSDLLEQSKKDSEVIAGGKIDVADRYIAPTILRKVPPTSAIMQGEIFGPILPILTVSDVREACEFINAREKPLALYLFSENKAKQDYVIEHTSSGGVCINDVIMHIVTPEMPFGGVGESGMGNYHGRYSIETFSHHKSVLRKKFMLDSSVRYPPYTQKKLEILRKGRNLKVPKTAILGVSALLVLGVALFLRNTSSGQDLTETARSAVANGLRFLLSYVDK